jgi:hypothetical protein
MAKAHAGVYTAVEVNGPLETGEGPKYMDLSSPATWSLIWFAVVLLFLFVL